MNKPTAPGTLRLPPKPPKAPVPATAPTVTKPSAAVPQAPPRKAPPAKHGTSRATKPAKATNPTRPTQPAKPAKPPLDEGERLSKRVAQMVPCSRSEAEQYIAGGWVRVNGKVVEEPQARVHQQQTVSIDPDASLLEQTSVTLLLHKPADWVDGSEESLAKLNRQARRSAFDDARTLLAASKQMAKDPSGIRVLQRHFKQLTCDVPLENAASGLVVYTQDWRIQRKLTEDLGFMEHEVMVDVQGEVTPQALHLLNRTLDSDEDLPQVKVSINSTTPERSRLRFAIKGAHRGLIAFLCERAKLEILDMRRIRLGRVALSDLPVGQWRYLGAHEKF